jgi:hypothetical protein
MESNEKEWERMAMHKYKLEISGILMQWKEISTL